jgi:hypothetical protein
MHPLSADGSPMPNPGAHCAVRIAACSRKQFGMETAQPRVYITYTN